MKVYQRGRERGRQNRRLYLAWGGTYNVEDAAGSLQGLGGGGG